MQEELVICSEKFVHSLVQVIDIVIYMPVILNTVYKKQLFIFLPHILVLRSYSDHLLCYETLLEFRCTATGTFLAVKGDRFTVS